MESLIIPLLFTHVTLYLAWKMTALEERHSRPDGNSIPAYATGGLGNLIGFSLMTIGVGFIDNGILRPAILVSAFGFSLLITLVLHHYWKRAAIGTTISLYKPNGTTTLAGWLHLAYVLFISMMVMVFLVEAPTADLLAVTLFAAGAALYTLAIVIDRIRGVI